MAPAFPVFSVAPTGFPVFLCERRRSLTRLFRQETGLSVGQWRLRRRVVAAIVLLAEGRSVTDTALTLGYDSVGARQSFRKVAGAAPSAYRRST